MLFDMHLFMKVADHKGCLFGFIVAIAGSVARLAADFRLDDLDLLSDVLSDEEQVELVGQTIEQMRRSTAPQRVTPLATQDNARKPKKSLGSKNRPPATPPKSRRRSQGS